MIERMDFVDILIVVAFLAFASIWVYSLGMIFVFGIRSQLSKWKLRFQIKEEDNEKSHE